MNRPIEDHDELAFIFSDEKYSGNKNQNTHSVDNQMSQDPMEQQIKNDNICCYFFRNTVQTQILNTLPMNIHTHTLSV
jgi:hypothetical protein